MRLLIFLLLVWFIIWCLCKVPILGIQVRKKLAICKMRVVGFLTRAIGDYLSHR